MHTHANAFTRAYARARAHTHTHTHTHILLCACIYIPTDACVYYEQVAAEISTCMPRDRSARVRLAQLGCARLARVQVCARVWVRGCAFVSGLKAQADRRSGTWRAGRRDRLRHACRRRTRRRAQDVSRGAGAGCLGARLVVSLPRRMTRASETSLSCSFRRAAPDGWLRCELRPDGGDEGAGGVEGGRRCVGCECPEGAGSTGGRGQRGRGVGRERGVRGGDRRRRL